MTIARSTLWWPAALTLAERAAARQDVSDSADPTALTPGANASATQRVNRWRTQRPFDRPEFLARRLRLDQLTEQSFEQLVAAPLNDLSRAERPSWVAQVEHADDVANWIAQRPHSLADDDSNGLAPVRAFVEPFVTAAMSRLFDEAQRIVAEYPGAPFEPQLATRLFEPSLWGHLVGRAVKVVILELNVARVQGTLSGDTPQQRCAHFSDQLRAGPVRDQIIEEYPVLARSLATTSQHGVEMASEFLRHLAADAPLLQKTFAPRGDLDMLSGLTAGAGDTHRCGRSVIVADFSLGTRVVFKPRSLSVDQHFSELIEWINARGQHPPLRAVRTITVGDHGWAEFVPNAPCASGDEVARFYDRFGAFLAILHVLNATDFHYENVIASGEFPMLIDLEALFHPLSEPAETGDEPEMLGWSVLQRSVLRTGVLPFRAYDSEQSRGLDMSAVGGSGGQRTPNRFPVLVAPGTDEMRFERDFIRLPDSQNRPTLGGQPVDPAEFTGRVLSGFERTYRILLTHRAELLSPRGPINRFANDEIRIVLRPTRQYALILSESHHPDVLRDALERDRLIDRLWVAVPSRPELEQIIQWEHADLLQGDVPLFSSRPASRELFTTHGVAIPDFFPRAGLASAVERIEAMGEDDLRHQRWIVEASLVSLLPVRRESTVLTPQTPRALGANRRELRATADELIDAAARVAQRLTTTAIRRDHRANWLGLNLVRERDWVVQPIGSDLYSGTAGIALFLSYFDYIVGSPAAGSIARDVMNQLSRRVVAAMDMLAAETVPPASALGAFGPLGGSIYTLAHIGALWEDRTQLDIAERLVGALSVYIETDGHLDIIGGTAGFIMASAALERVHPTESTRAILRRAADTLLERGARTPVGLSWTTSLSALQPLTGISHGASGIALALATVGGLLGDDALVDASLAAFCYERSTFDRVQQNWPDYRILDDDVRGPAMMWAWCHGAPGIGLARLSALGVRMSAEVLDDLYAALGSTARFGFGSNDSLCHGDLGNLDLFTRANELGYHGDWQQILASESTRLVARLRRGEWRCGIPGGVETPGLMNGLAGIGYGLLRLAVPDRVPSLLSLEAPRVRVSRP